MKRRLLQIFSNVFNPWKVSESDSAKFFCLSLMMLFVQAVYTSTRNVKDSELFLGADDKSSALSVIKIIVLIVVFISVFVLWKMIGKIGIEKTFLAVSIFIISYFLISGFFLFQSANQNAENKNAWLVATKSVSPEFLHDILFFITNWEKSLFYIFSELWGALVSNTLFWGVATKYTDKDKAVSHFTGYACMGAFGVIFSGFLPSIFHASGALSIKVSTYISLISGIAIVALRLYISKKFPKSKVAKKQKLKTKTSFIENLKTICLSKYLTLNALLLFFGSMVPAVVDQIFTSIGLEEMKQDFSQIKSEISIYHGLVTLASVFFISHLIEKTPWGKGIFVAPVLITICVIVFSFAVFTASSKRSVVLVGAAVSVLSVFTRRIIFDPNIQIAYNILSSEKGHKGRAAVESIFGRAGKMLASGTILAFSTILGEKDATNIFKLICPVLLVILSLWFLCAFALCKKRKTLAQEASKKDVTSEQLSHDRALVAKT